MALCRICFYLKKKPEHEIWFHSHLNIDTYLSTYLQTLYAYETCSQCEKKIRYKEPISFFCCKSNLTLLPIDFKFWLQICIIALEVKRVTYVCLLLNGVQLLTRHPYEITAPLKMICVSRNVLISMVNFLFLHSVDHICFNFVIGTFTNEN